MDTSEERRFWSHVARRGPDDCWLWTGARFRTGYGAFWFRGKMARAHRVAWELAHGPIPDGLMICHACDVAACVNVAHLSPGTRRRNTDEAVQRGRFASGDRNGLRRHPERNPALLHPERLARGERANKSALTETNISDIRRMFREGVKQTTIARSFCVSQQTISKIVKGETWTHVR